MRRRKINIIPLFLIAIFALGCNSLRQKIEGTYAIISYENAKYGSVGTENFKYLNVIKFKENNAISAPTLGSFGCAGCEYAVQDDSIKIICGSDCWLEGDWRARYIDDSIRYKIFLFLDSETAKITLEKF